MKFLVAVVLLFGCDGALNQTLPATPARMQRLVAGSLGLVGRPSTTCSSGIAKPGIPAEVWCAFYRAGAGEGAGTELWALNVTRAAAKPVPCDGTDPACLRLTTNLWTGDPLFATSHPAIHGFEGDTLIIYADATVTSADDAYRGSIKGWRPGWTAARTLTSPAGYLCRGNARAAVAHCLENVVEKSRNYEFDLLAGSLAGSAPGPLALAGHIRALGSLGQLMWGAAFSPDGEWFLWSSPADAEDTEVVRLSHTTDGGVGAPMEILRGAGRWQIAPDGKKLYYLKGFNYLDTAPAGALTMADFPVLANETLLQPNVGTYVPLGDFGEPDRGLGFLRDVTEGNGTFALLRDRTQPAKTMTLEGGVNEFLVSPDLRYTYLAKPDAPEGPTGVVAGNEGQGSCALNVGRSMYSVAFTPDAATVFWAQDSDSGFDIEGWYAPSDRCADKRRFSTNLAYLSTVRGGLLYADSDPDRLTMTLRFSALTNGLLPEDGGTVVREAIDTTLARGGKQFVVFTVTKGEEPGLYAYGPLPN